MTRLEKFRQLMAEQKIDGFLVTQPENRRYLSGFTGSSGILIITPERQAVATDSRYYEQVRQQCPDWELIEAGYDFVGNMLETLRQFELGARRVGFEPGHINVSTLNSWERALKGRLVLVDTEGFVEVLRMRKDQTEVASIRKAIAVADEALVHVTQWMKPGMTERQVAWEIESYMRTHGADAVSFEPIVASGPNSAMPHARPTERVLQAGEPITMDFGCIVEGYCSDLTRTVCLGEPADTKYLEVWYTVLKAQEMAEDGARVGMTGEQIDKLARDVIAEAGFGDYFGHGLGHGVGLAIHEGPRFSFTYPHEVPVGAIMTIEPGIYIPGWGGVRIEDMAWVRPNGLEILTAAPKEPVLNL
ncbi:MAG: Xaa-Pro dipeptidase [Anaerolineae bacterium]|nr:aminopeptidase P family protein [Anaerolineales bacterium]MCQ3974402.1 Xaa-Pro dipeptidase [Anaerolineae bacterium]